jgi:predicted nucleotidyltransferase component of viral defense system
MPSTVTVLWTAGILAVILGAYFSYLRERLAQIEQSYFILLPFALAEIVCLALPEIFAEKIRACYQRNKARDIYDLGMFATRPLDRAPIRRLVVLKLWQARDTFDPARPDAEIPGRKGFRLG